MEAVYSILYHGRLFESRDPSRGNWLLDSASSVYVHKDRTVVKAENYTRYVHLCGDGIFWSSKWEVLVDRGTRARVPRPTDQCVQRAGGVHLVALWLCGRSKEHMQNGDAVAKAWSPELEANPRSPVKVEPPWRLKGVWAEN